MLMSLDVAYIKTSLIDFPGRVAAVLFLPGCNFRCPYCHNAEIVDRGRAAPGLVPMEEFLAVLDKRKGLVSGVVISGGEPLLYEEAPAIAAAIRERGLAVKLDTNGSFPERIAPVSPDFVALDLKTSSSRYGLVAPGLPDAGDRLLRSLAYLRGSGIPFELRITCAPGVVGAPEIEDVAGLLEPGDDVFLQQFRPGGCLDPAWDSAVPYSRPELEAFLGVLKRRAPKARLRGA